MYVFTYLHNMEGMQPQEHIHNVLCLGKAQGTSTGDHYRCIRSSPKNLSASEVIAQISDRNGEAYDGLMIWRAAIFSELTSGFGVHRRHCTGQAQ